MKLTSHQLEVIRDATTNQNAFERVVAVLEQPSTQETQECAPPPISYDDRSDLIARAIDMIPASLFVKDRYSRFVMANRYTLDLFNMEHPREIIGKTDLDLLHEPEASTHYQAEQDLLRTGESMLDREIYVDEKYGDPHWFLSSKLPIVDDKGEVVGLIGINRDITQQKRAEQKLEAERNLLNVLINTIKDQVFIKDCNSRFMLANQATLDANEMSQVDEIIGKTDFDLAPKSLAELLFKQEQQILKSGQALEDHEVLIAANPERPNNKWLLVNKTPIYDENNEPVMLVGVNRDITDQKMRMQQQFEIEIERKRTELLNDFIVATSHELLTPMTVIRSAAYLCGRVDTPEKRQKYVRQIDAQIDDLTRLVKQLILVTELEQQTTREGWSFTLKSLCQQVMEHKPDRVQQRDIKLNAHVDHLDQQIYGDRALLNTALSAIIDNAAKYSDAGDSITITSEVTDDLVIIKVKDTGIGMTPDVQARIFEDFYRADKARSERSFGLGLPIARRIIGLHGGEIHVESEPDVGTTVKVSLPTHQ